MAAKVVTAGVLIIGNEILSGRTQDVNLKYIAEHLGNLGISIREAQVIPDVESVIVERVNAMRVSYDYVLTTGGIGPTHDDITIDSVAKAFGVGIVVNKQIEERIRSRPAPDDVMQQRLRMARVPDGATLIENTSGGPQGVRMDNVCMMAGIPFVLRNMLPTIDFEKGDIVHSRSVKAYLGESNVSKELGEIQARIPDVDIGSYPFTDEDRYGTNLVVRGTDLGQIAAAVKAIEEMIVEAGETPH